MQGEHPRESINVLNDHDDALFQLIDQVVWKRLYNGCSGMDSGSLFQLRNLITRRNAVSGVTKDLTACEEFMDLITVSHVLAAAIHIQQT